MEAARLTWRHLGEVLVHDNLLTQEQLRDAFAKQQRSGLRLGEIAVEEGWITSADLAMALAKQFGLDFVDLGDVELDPDATAMLPEALARRYLALPVRFVEENVLLVAVAEPTNVLTSDDLRLALGVGVRLAVADRRDLERALKVAYRLPIEVDDAGLLGEASRSSEREEIWQAATSAPAVKLVNATLSQAIEDGASDIHFEPCEGQLAVRARIDGVMRDVAEIPKSMQAGVTSRLKIMAELDIAERRAPQDGRVGVRFGGLPVDLRIAVLPTTHGEQVVLRVLHRAAGRLSIDELGMSRESETAFARSIGQPYGAVIVCGPTGSGKTTTLYTALHMLNDRERVLMTIEDPVEYQIPGVNQIEVKPKHGLTFAAGLRTILRSDPDVLLVGEIRDDETAKIAIQAAMTGHLVLTTLHSHNAASALARLKDMDVEPGLLASSVNCIVAQRLARRLCQACRKPYDPTAGDISYLELDNWQIPGELYRAAGCAECGETGYRGRVALYEVMTVHGPIRALVEASTEEIFAAAVAQGMTTLRHDGIRHCLAGISSLDEIRRVTGDRLV